MLNFDLEANGLLDTVSRIHCMVIGKVGEIERTRYDPSKVLEGLKVLKDALEHGEQISGHNIRSTNSS